MDENPASTKIFADLKQAIEKRQSHTVVVPGTELGIFISHFSQYRWKTYLQRETGLRLPGLKIDPLQFGLSLALIAFPAQCYAIHGCNPFAIVCAAAALIFACTGPIMAFPKQIRTVGDLTSAITALNVSQPEFSVKPGPAAA